MSIPAVIVIVYLAISIFAAAIMHGKPVIINAYQNIALISALAVILYLGGLFA